VTRALPIARQDTSVDIDAAQRAAADFALGGVPH